MQVEYVNVTPSMDDKVTAVVNQLSGKDATILSRIARFKEVAAIVPMAGTEQYLWVWLSGSEGAYCNGNGRELRDIAKTIISGDWIIQPNAKIILETQ